MMGCGSCILVAVGMLDVCVAPLHPDLKPCRAISRRVWHVTTGGRVRELCGSFQTPPDEVVKCQTIDVTEVVLYYASDGISSNRAVETGHRGVSRFPRRQLSGRV